MMHNVPILPFGHLSIHKRSVYVKKWSLQAKNATIFDDDSKIGLHYNKKKRLERDFSASIWKQEDFVLLPASTLMHSKWLRTPFYVGWLYLNPWR